VFERKVILGKEIIEIETRAVKFVIPD